MEKKKFSIYKLLSNISIVGLFLAVGLFVLSIMGLLKFNAGISVTIAIIMIICACSLMLLPWIKNLENKKMLVLSNIFIVITIICGILWIVSAIMIVNTVAEKEPIDLARLSFLRTSLIITVQFLTATTIAGTIMKYKKTMIPFQIVYYVSLAYLDFFITCLLSGLVLYPELKFNTAILGLIFNKITITLFVLAIFYVLLSGSIIKAIDRRKNINTYNEVKKFSDNKQLMKKIEEETNNSVESKLSKLKDMFDKNLITEEEYQAKRAEILKDI